MICRVWKTVLATVLSGLILPAFGQRSYYVVVGAFSTEGNAEELIAKLPKTKSDTAYSFTDENLVHLYVLKTNSEQNATEKAVRLQKTINELKASEGIEESVTLSKTNGERSISYSTADVQPDLAFKSDAGESRGSAEETDVVLASAPVKTRSNMYKFLISDNKGNPLQGKVHFIDYRNERDLASYQANGYTDILSTGKRNDIEVVCGVFGYKLSGKTLDYNNPSLIEGAYRDESGAWVVPYELERLGKGDVSVMYNVVFNKDAVVMLPQSQVDLDELVRMMFENPRYEITVHGHANGKHDRKITTIGKSYFQPKASREYLASAKELSQLRAEAVRQYLIEHGINSSRIKTYAWGGRYELVNPQSAFSKLNDRIEIEIRKD